THPGFSGAARGERIPRHARSVSGRGGRLMNGHNFGRTDLPEEQSVALRKAIRWEIVTIAYTLCTITLVAFVVGNSQAMRTAWIEDMLSLLPQVAFLIALIFIRHRPSVEHPYGRHRAMGVGHLVAG